MPTRLASWWSQRDPTRKGKATLRGSFTRGSSSLAGPTPTPASTSNPNPNPNPETTYRDPSFGRSQGLSYRANTSLGQVPEEGRGQWDQADLDLDLDLENEGLYRESYTRLLLLYTLTPALSLLTITLLLSLLPHFLWPPIHSAPSTHPHTFPPPLPEFFIASALYALSHSLRLPLFSLLSSLPLLRFSPNATSLLSTTLHTLLSTLLRFSGLAVLSLRHQMTYPLPTVRDGVFARVWFFALGWGAAEVVVGILQGYEQVRLYRDVLVGPGGEGRKGKVVLGEVIVGSPNGISIGATGIGSPDSMRSVGLGTVRGEDAHSAWGREVAAGEETSRERARREAERELIDAEIEALLAMKAREELEEVYGCAVIKIPPTIPLLLRLDSLLLSLGLTLLLSWAYLSSPISLSPLSPSSHSSSTNHTNNTTFALTLLLTVFLHSLLSIACSPPVMRRVPGGLAGGAYAALMGGVGACFAGVGVWGGLG